MEKSFTTAIKLYIIGKSSGCGSVWLERTAGGREVAGSNPVTPIFYIYYRKEHVESISVITQNAFFVFARHGRALAGASPEHARVVGNV